MTTPAPPRSPGRRGRLPLKPAHERLPLRFAHEYLAEPIPSPAYPIDVTGGLTGWGMLGNDAYGDCGEAGRLHYEMATAACAGVPVPSFTDQDAVTEYLAYTGGADTGVVLEDFLLWSFQHGRIKGFAPVDHADAALCDAMMQRFRGLYVGVNLTPDAEERFAQHEPWAVSVGQHPDPDAGHCIVKVKATGTVDTFVTWGALQDAESEWTRACLDEAYVVWTTEDPAVQWDDLRADLTGLSGTF